MYNIYTIYIILFILCDQSWPVFHNSFLIVFMTLAFISHSFTPCQLPCSLFFLSHSFTPCQLSYALFLYLTVLHHASCHMPCFFISQFYTMPVVKSLVFIFHSFTPCQLSNPLFLYLTVLHHASCQIPCFYISQFCTMPVVMILAFIQIFKQFHFRGPHSLNICLLNLKLDKQGFKVPKIICP